MAKINLKLNLKQPPGKKLHTSRKLSSLIGIDFGTSATKVVRLKKEKGGIALLDAALLPPVDFSAAPDFALPRALRDRYAAICATLPESQLRVFAHAVEGEYDLRQIVRAKLNVADDFRVNGALVSEHRREHSILGVAVPEDVVARILVPFAEGAPAPCSLEVSGMAASSAFLMSQGARTSSRTICLIDLGETTMYVSFFFQNRLQIVNRFDLGARRILNAVNGAFGLDEELSISLLTDGAVDVSTILKSTLSPVLRQLPILKEFAERKNSSPLSGVYLSGGLAAASAWHLLVKDSLGIQPESWNPFEKISLPDEGLPESVKGQESRFASAVGMAIAELESV